MYGGSGKLGRGGGGGRGPGGGNKRNIHSNFHPAPLHHRQSSGAASAVAPTPSGRLSMGGAGAAQRNRLASASASSAAASASSVATEESFNLVTGNPLNFAMIIRLAPDLVEEIKRVESQGSTARIKFDANATNPAGNVISVGGKDFRFTWSRETAGDLCDIYEERQSGEDGNGLLVESGSAWRKLNVHRVLDESTQNHIKMRSKEAENVLKARKAIVLDHGNPSMKNNVKAMVAAESSWRMKPPFKKRKAEPPPGGPPKSIQRSALTTTPPPKGRPPASSPSSPPVHSVVPGSPVGTNLMKGHTDIEDTVSVQGMNKTVSSEKDAAGRVISSAGRGKQGQKAVQKGIQPSDLRSMLISLLGESSSKGMSLKALEKAIGDVIPNSVRQIEPILKKIAIYQAPGRYFLKPGVEMESFKKPRVSEGQSSPEDNDHASPAHDGQQPALETTFSVRSEANELQHAESDHKYEEANNLVERGDVSHPSTDLFDEKKVSDNSEGPVGSSSDSGSDSDSESDSSDSGSDSGTHSRSESRSSSDSESDASTKSEASDEDVDIMTSDDDKQVKQKFEASAVGSFKSPPHWKNSDSEHASIFGDEKQDGHVSDIIEIEKDFLEDPPVREVTAPSDSVRNLEVQKAVGETTLYYHNEDQDRNEYSAKIHGESDNVPKDGSKHGWSDSSEKSSRGKYKRVLEEKQEDKPDRNKKLKPGNSEQVLVSGSRAASFQGSHQNLSPDRPFEEIARGLSNQVASKSRRDINSSSGSHKSYDQTSSGKSISDSQQPTQRSIDPNSRVKSSSSVEKPGKHSENMGRGSKQPDKLLQTEGFPNQKDKFNKEMPDVYSSMAHKGSAKISKEDSVEKHPTPAETRYRKHEPFGNSKESGSVLNSPKDENLNFRDSTVVNGRPNAPQRELSDLELGELREPEETSGLSKQLNRKGSFKQSENWKPESSKVKPVSKMSSDSRKSSPLNANFPVSGIAEGMPNRGIPEHFAGDNSKPHPRGMQTHSRYQSRVDNVDNGTQLNRVVESGVRNRHSDVRTSQDITSEVNGNYPSKGLATVSQEHEGKQVAAPSKKDSRWQKSSAIPDLNDKQKDCSLTGSSDGYQKRRESSSDENSCPYSKFEKDEPEFKGPIKDGTQYKEYVDEFQEKYGNYISLNNILEFYRDEFLKYERDLEASKGKDMQRYYEVEQQIRESYRRCGERFKRLKKIFLVLHGELQHLKQRIHDFATPFLKGSKD